MYALASAIRSREEGSLMVGEGYVMTYLGPSPPCGVC